MSGSIFIKDEETSKILPIFSEELHEAFKSGSFEYILRLLSDYKLNEVKEQGGVTLLHVAAMYNRADLIRYLVKEGCDINAQTDMGDTPLLYAVRDLHEDAAFALSDAGAKIWLANYQDRNALLGIFTSRVEKTEQTNKVKTHIFMRLLGNLKNIEVDTECMKKIFYSWRLPITLAVRTRNVKFMSALLESGMNVNATECGTGMTPLQIAVTIGDFEMVTFLLKCGADVNAKNNQGKKAVTSISDYESSDNLQALLDAGCEVYECDNNGCMQLSSVLEHCKEAIIRTILNYGFDLNRKDGNGLSMAHYIAKNKNKGVAELFDESQKIDPNNKDGDLGKTPLHIAADEANLKFMKILLKKNADVNCEDSSGCTPVFSAIRHNTDLVEREQCIEFLFDSGADVNHVNSEGCSVVKMALSLQPALVLKPVLMQVAYLLALGKPVREESLRQIESSRVIKGWFDSFKAEFEEMKRPVIKGHKVTYFDILSAPWKKTVEYMRNSRVRLNFKRKVGDQFPLRGKQLLSRFDLAVELWKKIHAAESTIGNIFNIEHMIARIIVSYLDF